MVQLRYPSDLLVRNWGAVLLRGLLAVLFGLVTLFVPGVSLVVLVLLYGAYALVDGILAIVAAFRRRQSHEGPRWAYFLLGLLGIAAGVVTLLWPGITALVLLYVIACWALVGGVFEIIAAVRLRKEITGEWLLALSGIAHIAFGVLLMMSPAVGALALVLWIGACTLVYGAVVVALAFRLRSWEHRDRPEFPGSFHAPPAPSAPGG
jgi:uncharacterized membrane protein HdeD (DUF308 family)